MKRRFFLVAAVCMLSLGSDARAQELLPGVFGGLVEVDNNATYPALPPARRPKVYWACTVPGCGPCAACHAAPTQKPQPGFTSVSHLEKYKYTLKPGERIPWGNTGAQLTLLNGRKCVTAPGKKPACLPENTVIARDPRGKIVGAFAVQNR